MKTYILDSLNRMKRFGESLDVKTILCNKAWQIFNDTGEKEMYIFQESGEVLLSNNGIVSHGNWQYISANKSILISIKESSYMLHPSFLINNILALKLDGTERYMLMIEEHSFVALQLKSLEDLNKYFLSIEANEIEMEKEKNQKNNEEVLRQDAVRAWEAKRDQVLNSNKDDKHCNHLMIGVWVLLLSSVFLVVFAQSYILVAIASFVTVFSMIVALIYDSKRDKIYQNELNLFIENYIKVNFAR